MGCAGSPDLNLVVVGLFVLLHVDVDWEVCVHVAHLVLVTLCDADDQVVDNSLDGTEGCDIFARAVVNFDLHD
jgi:hypothetical protein